MAGNPEALHRKKSMKIHLTRGYIETLVFATYPDGRILALDGGCRPDVPKMVSFVTEKLGRSYADVGLQLVSHSHPDHAGAVGYLRKKYGVPVAAPANMDRWYSGFGGFLQHKIDIYLTYTVVKAMGQPFHNLLYSRFTRPDYPLKDGQLLPGFPDWQALAAPGHTGHDMVFYHAESKTLYASDVILAVNRHMLVPFPLLFPGEMEETYFRLRNLDVKHLILAHSGMVRIENMASVIDPLLKLLKDKKTHQRFKHILPFTRFSPVLKAWSENEAEWTMEDEEYSFFMKHVANHK